MAPSLLGRFGFCVSFCGVTTSPSTAWQTSTLANSNGSRNRAAVVGSLCFLPMEIMKYAKSIIDSQDVSSSYLIPRKQCSNRGSSIKVKCLIERYGPAQSATAMTTTMLTDVTGQDCGDKHRRTFICGYAVKSVNPKNGNYRWAATFLE